MQKKAFFANALGCLMAVGALSGLTACNKGKDLVDFTVTVDASRDARVLHISDPQLMDDGEEEKYCFRYVRQVVEAYDPDLILVTGDLVYGKFDHEGKAFRAYVDFMETLDTPWAPVFGNHDNESAMGVDWQCKQLENAENCLFKQRNLTGNGNYSVGIEQGGKLTRAFFMLDSNGCSEASMASLENGHTGRSAGIWEDQREWYVKECTEIEKRSPDTKITFAFHIQPMVFSDAIWTYYDEETWEIYENLDENPLAQERGDFGYIGAEAKGPWDTYGDVYAEMLDMGADSIMVGHEHLNSASILYEGVRLQYGQKCSQYDRYNKWYNGEIIGNYEKKGQAIMGGTAWALDKEDGSIKNPGLYLYDWTKA